jgi:hypothetical protein
MSLKDKTYNSSTNFIAFLDVLGFKEIINANSHNYVVDLYDQVLDKIVIESIYQSNAEYVLTNKTEPTIKETHINSLLVSDSLILWTNKNDIINSFMDIIICIKYLMFNAFKNGLALRGCIEKGEFNFVKKTHETNISNYSLSIVGKALTEAYLNESKQNWAGCVISEKAISSFNQQIQEKKKNNIDTVSLQTLINHKFIVPYQVPYKTGNIKEDYVIDWTNLFTPKTRVTEAEVINSFKEFNRSIDNWDVNYKIKNTLEFLQKMNNEA